MHCGESEGRPFQGQTNARFFGSGSFFNGVLNRRPGHQTAKEGTMGKMIKEGGDQGRLHIDSPLMGESLVSKALLEETESKEYFRVHPDINVLKIGGQSIMGPGGEGAVSHP